MRRLLRLALIAALAVVAVPVVAAAPAAAEERPIAVGTELMAVEDVTLHKAEIQKGSRVSVTQVLVRDGHVDGVSVALADGHVVKVTMNVVHSFFRVAD